MCTSSFRNKRECLHLCSNVSSNCTSDYKGLFKWGPPNLWLWYQQEWNDHSAGLEVGILQWQCVIWIDICTKVFGCKRTWHGYHKQSKCLKGYGSPTQQCSWKEGRVDTQSCMHITSMHSHFPHTYVHKWS